MMSHERMRDRARGCLVGGAVGDALGYPVEFMSLKEIRRQYGPAGIRALEAHGSEGTAVVSDDTQMTLFTANGLLLGAAHPKERTMERWIHAAYLDWLDTQWATELCEGHSWLHDLPKLYARRAPGNTCLSALESGRMGSVDAPVNSSKGCGGIMRVAPVAVFGRAMGWDEERTVRLGAEAAAITHGHPLGWLSAAALVDIVGRVLDGADPERAARQCAEALAERHSDDPWAGVMALGIRNALELAKNGREDADNIAALGGGWVGEEALYIAVYCASRHANDFDAAMVASVNHDGDSDSTGAITGNIVGAHLGGAAISEKWTSKLELHEILVQMADDLCAAEDERSEGWDKRYRR